jgi:hypothetical protein
MITNHVAKAHGYIADANRLSTAMRAAMRTYRATFTSSDRSVRVGTTCALIDRGLITTAYRNEVTGWLENKLTDKGRLVLAAIIDPEGLLAEASHRDAEQAKRDELDPPLTEGTRQTMAAKTDADLARLLDKLQAVPQDQRSRRQREAIQYGGDLQKARLMPWTALVGEAEALLPSVTPTQRRELSELSVPLGWERTTYGVHRGMHHGTMRGLYRRGLIESRLTRHPDDRHANYHELTPLGLAVRFVIRRERDAAEARAYLEVTACP